MGPSRCKFSASFPVLVDKGGSPGLKMEISAWIVFSPVHTSPFLFSVWSVNKNVKFYKRPLLWPDDDLSRKMVVSLHCCYMFSSQHSDSSSEMIELCRLELARITTTINKNKVGRHKDTVGNWSPVTQIQCLPVSNIQNIPSPVYATSSNSNSCKPFISHQ